MARILQILANPNLLTGILLVMPVILLVFYVILDRISKHTKSKLDDEVAAGIAEVLEGLGKPVPSHVEPLEAHRLQDLHDGLLSAKKSTEPSDA